MEKTKFYKKKWFLYLSLVLFAPLGLVLLWTVHKDTIGKKAKIILSTVFAIWFLIIAVSGNDDSTTDQKLTASTTEQTDIANEEKEAEVNTTKKETTSKAAPSAEVKATQEVAVAETVTPTTSPEPTVAASETVTVPILTLNEIPTYTGQTYVAINGNTPSFDSSVLTTQSVESYSDLDSLGRCGVAYANVGKDIMPTEERGAIGSVKPSGWQTIKYDNVDGKYLYNRCHLIGYQLTGENANNKNLITGTRYFNTEGMLPFENMVADYVKETGNHVAYRVTPIYEESNLVASGVQMEALSVEDSGKGICFNVFCYNVQPGITIDYATGNSTSESGSSTAQTTTVTQTSESVAPVEAPTVESQSEATEATYILNKNTKKFHTPGCSSVKQIKEENKESFTGDKQDLINQGYDACKNCNP